MVRLTTHDLTVGQSHLSLHFTVNNLIKPLIKNCEHDTDCSYPNMYWTVTLQMMLATVCDTVLQHFSQ
jgi:hypothetical protein